MQEWEAARATFVAAKRALKAAQTKRLQAAAAANRIAGARELEASLRNRLSGCIQSLSDVTAEVGQAQTSLTAAEAQVARIAVEVNTFQQLRPPWWRYFTATAKQWRRQERHLIDETVAARDASEEARERWLAADEARQVESERRADLQERHLVSNNQLLDLQNQAGEHRLERPTTEWFDPTNSGQFAEATAWIDTEIAQRQTEVFAAAMAVHERFLTVAGRRVRTNLLNWSDLLRNRIQHRDEAGVVEAVWQTLFLVVPMVSTTFASVARMMRHVHTPLISWLIIDEAGQSRPAEAIGALRRSQRAVVVGDPAQLEPVVTIPKEIVAEVMREHSVDQPARRRSLAVQDLADGASTVGTMRGRHNWIGSPLVVHHRCLDPMFTVSNSISYEGAMVQGRPAPETDRFPRLGPSRWIDVPHRANGHFNAEEAAELIDLLGLLDRSDWESGDGLSIGVASPFRDVIAGLAEPLRRYRQKLDVLWSDPDELAQHFNWATVHTYQGQERNIMFLVLGGGTDGAIEWACEPPNLINVAITRAKDRLFVIGDAQRWTRFRAAEALHEEMRRGSVHFHQ